MGYFEKIRLVSVTASPGTIFAFVEEGLHADDLVSILLVA